MVYSGALLLWRSSYYDSVVAHYILIWLLASSLWGGQWRFENVGLNVSKRHHIFFFLLSCIAH